MKEGLIKDRNELYGPYVVKNLQKRQFEAYYVETKEEALEKAIELIPKDHVVGWGGSYTIKEIGLVDRLYADGYKVMDREKAGDNFDAWAETMKRILVDANTFITSANAVTEAGELLNVDGNGNRLAAYCYGPESVVVIVGMNKIVRDVKDAVFRIQTVAAPINGRRFPDINTPCKHTGRCAECTAPDCMCCQWLVTRMSNPKGRIKVIVCGEKLGF